MVDAIQVIVISASRRSNSAPSVTVSDWDRSSMMSRRAREGAKSNSRFDIPIVGEGRYHALTCAGGNNSSGRPTPPTRRTRNRNVVQT